MSKLQGRLDKLRQWVWRLEDVLILLLLLGMIGLACLQIFIRNAFDAGLLWADPVLRVLMLWSALLGAMAASRHDKHMSIHIFANWLGPRPLHIIKIFTALFAALICGIAAFYAGWFVMDEYQYSTADIAGIRGWWFELIMPLAFSSMALRFALQILREIRTLLKGSPP
ncbi:MAG TPA: TRAP transporter small permease [Gammaproteobacteria bacterium]|nr:TRAP transporter small permease [Gammaproteobacteria bacterium]